jgi:hypothetical protein
MDNERGMRVKLGCIAFAQLFVLRIARAKDTSGKSSCKSCEVGIRQLRDGKRCGLLRKAGPCQERKRGTEALPEERTPIHRFHLKRQIGEPKWPRRRTGRKPDTD